MSMQIDKLSDDALREFAIEHDPGFESADQPHTKAIHPQVGQVGKDQR
jgi:hypothetical protein